MPLGSSKLGFVKSVQIGADSAPVIPVDPTMNVSIAFSGNSAIYSAESLLGTNDATTVVYNIDTNFVNSVIGYNFTGVVAGDFTDSTIAGTFTTDATGNGSVSKTVTTTGGHKTIDMNVVAPASNVILHTANTVNLYEVTPISMSGGDTTLTSNIVQEDYLSSAPGENLILIAHKQHRFTTAGNATLTVSGSGNYVGNANVWENQYSTSDNRSYWQDGLKVRSLLVGKGGDLGYSYWGIIRGERSISIGNTYTINTIGTSDFTAFGAPDNNVGTIFTATSSGLISGGSFVIGTTYTINNTGNTNFTLIGAANNNQGTVFTATGVGSGTGTAYGPGTGTVASATNAGSFGTTTGTPGTFNGAPFEIVLTGNTDFVSVGAADNNVGTRFFSTGAGSGTGAANRYNGANSGAGAGEVGVLGYSIANISPSAYTMTVGGSSEGNSTVFNGNASLQRTAGKGQVYLGFSPDYPGSAWGSGLGGNDSGPPYSQGNSVIQIEFTATDLADNVANASFPNNLAEHVEWASACKGGWGNFLYATNYRDGGGGAGGIGGGDYIPGVVPAGSNVSLYGVDVNYNPNGKMQAGHGITAPNNKGVPLTPGTVNIYPVTTYTTLSTWYKNPVLTGENTVTDFAGGAGGNDQSGQRVSGIGAEGWGGAWSSQSTNWDLPDGVITISYPYRPQYRFVTSQDLS